ncbi:MAG: 50S ribosomal protein L25 [Lachnoclostridium sp.]
MNTLKAEKRNMEIKAKRLRREGFVTGNVFGKKIEKSIPLKLECKEVEKLLKEHGKGSQILLDVEGQVYDVLIKDVEYNPLKGQVDEIDFQELVKGEKVHSVAEVVLLHHEKVTTGVLQQLIHEIEYKATPDALVEKVEIDVSNLRVGDTILVKDLPIAADKDIDLHTDLDATVVTVYEVHNAASSEDETGEDAEKAE